jgi:hypothetical protein
MKAKVALSTLLVALAFFSGPSVWAADEPRADLNLTGGIQFLNSDWKPADEEYSLGLEGDVKPQGWPMHLYASYKVANSASQTVDIPSGGTVSEKSRTDEVDLGVRKYFSGAGTWNPFINGGLAIVGGELKTTGPLETVKASDTGAGFWIGAGAVYVWNGFLNTGFQAKYTYGNVKLNGDSLNAGGIQISALIGARF